MRRIILFVSVITLAIITYNKFNSTSKKHTSQKESQSKHEEEKPKKIQQTLKPEVLDDHDHSQHSHDHKSVITKEKESIKTVNTEVLTKLSKDIISKNKSYKKSKITILDINQDKREALVLVEGNRTGKKMAFNALVNLEGKVLKTWGSPIFEDASGKLRFGLPVPDDD